MIKINIVKEAIDFQSMFAISLILFSITSETNQFSIQEYSVYQDKFGIWVEYCRISKVVKNHVTFWFLNWNTFSENIEVGKWNDNWFEGIIEKFHKYKLVGMIYWVKI